MGVYLTPIVVKKITQLEALRGKTLAVDGNNELHQFVALIRKPDGTPLADRNGNVTSHLAGLMLRSTKLIHDYDLRLTFVFDGKPPQMKEAEVTRRRELKEKAVKEWKQALAAKDYAKAFSKAVATGKLTQSMIDDAKRLLSLLGIPFVQAPSEGEAQAAYIASKKDVWASASRDYDSLLFGTPRLLRFLTISGTEFLPSKGVSRQIKPELIELEEMLTKLRISRDQLVDLGILIGTDFNAGVKGIGPKKALQLLSKYGSLENLPQEIKSKLPQNYEEIKEFFLNPPVTDDYSTYFGDLQEEKLYSFLVEERDFSAERVSKVVERMTGVYEKNKQADLARWLSS